MPAGLIIIVVIALCIAFIIYCYKGKGKKIKITVIKKRKTFYSTLNQKNTQKIAVSACFFPSQAL